MSALETLRAIAAGDRAARGLLQDCRYQGCGVRAFGRAPILEHFRAYPLDLAAARPIVETPRAIALIDPAAGTALIADLSDGHIARLWRLGDTLADAPSPPAVSVPVDPDCSQLAGGLLFRAADHPELAPEHEAMIAALEPVFASADPTAFRVRAAITRAFSQGPRGVALAALQVWSAGGHRARRDTHALVSFLAPGGALAHHALIVDTAGGRAAHARAWTPRL